MNNFVESNPLETQDNSAETFLYKVSVKGEVMGTLSLKSLVCRLRD